jgi:hypothetical protein
MPHVAAFGGLPDTGMSFHTAVLLYPLATIAHILEEWRGFVAWAQSFASTTYSRRGYVTTHVAAIVLSMMAAFAVRAVPAAWSGLLFFGVFFGPSITCNALFHIGGTVLTRTYCPGVVTSVLLYVPVTVAVVGAALRDGVLSPASLAATMVFAAIFHVAEVGHNVFARW